MAAWDGLSWSTTESPLKPNAPLNAGVIRHASEVLQNQLGYKTPEDLHTAQAKDENLKTLKDAWLHLPSQRSGVTFNYLLILAGFQSVKSDRMVIRFIEEHSVLGGRRLTPTEAAALIKKVGELNRPNRGGLTT